MLGSLVLVAGAARADAGDRLYDRGHAKLVTVRDSPSRRVYRKPWLDAVTDLARLLEKYPDHRRVPDALFDLGSAYQGLGQFSGDRSDAERAVEYYRELRRRFPAAQLARQGAAQAAQLCERRLKDAKCAAEFRGAPAALVEVGAISIVPQGRAARVTIATDGPVEVLARSLPPDESRGAPGRFFVDLAGARMRPAERTAAPDAGSGSAVLRVRAAQFDERTVRVVLDLAAPEVRAELERAVEANGVVVVAAWPSAGPAPPVPGEAQAGAADPGAAATAVEVIPSPPPAAPPSAPPPLATSIPLVEKQEQARKRPVRIVIDPGHGGDDTGARGPRGTLEKDVCLAIAAHLHRLLAREPGFEAYLTRSDDRRLRLSERTRMANALEGDLFISIHANAARRKTASGVSTYFLDNANDEDSARIALAENASDELGEATPKPGTEDYYLELMKSSLMKNFHTDQSIELAHRVQRTLARDLKKGWA